MDYRTHQEILLVGVQPIAKRALSRLFDGDRVQWVEARSCDEALELLGRHEVAVLVYEERRVENFRRDFLLEARAKHPTTSRVAIVEAVDLGWALATIDRADLYRLLPWPASVFELGGVVREALEQSELPGEALRLLEVTRSQAALLARVEELEPEILDEAGEIVAAEIGPARLPNSSLVRQIRAEAERFEAQVRLRRLVAPWLP